jgi:hypothetical protein
MRLEDVGAKAYAPVVRFLNLEGTQWVGSGFLVPPKSGDTALTVMTCAHVIADALGDRSLMHRVAAPEGKVGIVFAGPEIAGQTPVYGQVAEWRRSPADGEIASGPIDIAVVRFEGVVRPDGVAYAEFGESAEVGSRVLVYGPRSTTDVRMAAAATFVRCEVVNSTQESNIEILADRGMPNNVILQGCSGGPLTVNRTNVIVGMVRSAYDAMNLQAYAVEFGDMAAVWPPLAKFSRPKRRANALPIFDLIDRHEQILILSKETRTRLEARHKDGKEPAMIFAVAGPLEEHHGHLRRRARHEISRHQKRGQNREIELSDVDVELPGWGTTANRIEMMAEALLRVNNAESTSGDHLRTAFGYSAGWIVQVTVKADATAEDAELLTAFLALWQEISAGAKCEMYLALSFEYQPATAPACSAALLKRSLVDDPRRLIVELPDLRAVSLDDISRWQDDITRDGFVDDDKAAILASQIEEKFKGQDALPMRRLLNAIQLSRIDATLSG